MQPLTYLLGYDSCLYAGHTSCIKLVAEVTSKDSGLTHQDDEIEYNLS